MKAHGNAYKLLGILQYYAPSVRDQQVVADLISRAEQDLWSQRLGTQEIERELEKTLVGMLSDGLNYRNWPWLRGE